MSEDAVIKNRLLLDFKPLKKCIKRFHTLIQQDPTQDKQLLLDQFLTDLYQFELILKKTRLVQTMNQRQIQQYEQEAQQIETDIQTAKLDMLRLKMKLDQAVRIKNHRLEYEEIAKKILNYPSRESTERNIDKLKSDIQKIQAAKQALVVSRSLRREHFGRVVMALHELQDAALMENNDGIQEPDSKSDMMGNFELIHL